MKKVILAIAIIATFSFSSCKKCWDCEIGQAAPTKTCDQQQMEYYEGVIYYNNINGSVEEKHGYCN